MPPEKPRKKETTPSLASPEPTVSIAINTENVAIAAASLNRLAGSGGAAR